MNFNLVEKKKIWKNSTMKVVVNLPSYLVPSPNHVHGFRTAYYKVCVYEFRKDGILTKKRRNPYFKNLKILEKSLLNFNEKKCQSDTAFCACFQILTQVVIIVTLFLCSVAYWILMTDQVNVVQLFIIHSVSKYVTKW